MARAKWGRKSQAIREYLAQNPGAKTSEVVAALRRLKVTGQMVSTIKGKMPATSTATTPAAKDMISLTSLLAAKALVEKLGGIQQAKEAVAAYAKLGQ